MEPAGPVPEVLHDGLLGQDGTDDATVAGAVGVGGQQDDEAGGGAHQDGVHEDPEGLDEALAHGVGHGGGTGRVGDGAQARLVGEQAAPHAVEHGRRDPAGGAEQGLVGAEGPMDDLGQDARELTDVDQEDH